MFFIQSLSSVIYNYMIEEIEAPLPTIQNLEARKLERQVERQKLRTLLAKEEVAFNRDYSLVDEFAKTNNIPYSMAEAIIIAFFEEIKTNLLDGKIIRVNSLGIFYIAGPHRDAKNNFIIPNGKKNDLVPKLKVFKYLRDCE